MYSVARENKDWQCGKVGGGMLAQKGLLSHMCKGMIRGTDVLWTVPNPSMHSCGSKSASGSESAWMRIILVTWMRILGSGTGSGCALICR
jgi:hypothetical protein